METKTIGVWDTTIRGNKWIAFVLSIMPGIGHLYLAEYNNTKRNFVMGISLIGLSITYITILSYSEFASVYSRIGYALVVMYSSRDAYLHGRNYNNWSGMIIPKEIK